MSAIGLVKDAQGKASNSFEKMPSINLKNSYLHQWEQALWQQQKEMNTVSAGQNQTINVSADTNQEIHFRQQAQAEFLRIRDSLAGNSPHDTEHQSLLCVGDNTYHFDVKTIKLDEVRNAVLRTLPSQIFEEHIGGIKPIATLDHFSELVQRGSNWQKQFVHVSENNGVIEIAIRCNNVQESAKRELVELLTKEFRSQSIHAMRIVVNGQAVFESSTKTNIV